MLIAFKFDKVVAMSTMMSPFRLGPEWTPSAVKKLIFYTACISVSCALINAFFTQLMKIPGPQQWLSLSWWGISRYFLWQPVTYLFVHPMGYEGAGLSYLIGLLFNLYIIWVMGTDICQRISEKSFIKLYFTCGIAGGLISLFIMPILGQYAFLAGPSAAIMGILICWAFLHPEQELLLFFLIPIKAKWLSLGIIGAAVLISFSSFQFVNSFFYFSGAFIGYLYALIAWGIHSPFTGLYQTELLVIRSSQKFKKLFQFLIPKKKNSSKNKIVDIQTGEPSGDEAFIDAMLEKISRYGESSLSFSERKRMKKISEKRSAKNRHNQ